MNRRGFFHAAAAAAGASLLTTNGLALASSYPARSVRVIVPYPPGGGTDTVSRLVFERVASSLGQPFVIENKGGAGTTIGLAELARSKPDGYTVGVGGSSDPLLPLLYDRLSFNPTSDLTFVATLATVPIVLVAGPGIPARTMEELLTVAKSSGDPLPYASPSVASPHHFAGIHLAGMSGMPLEHVGYKGTGPAMTDLLGGHVPLAMLGLPSALPFAKEGKLKILGVASATRSALAPEIPTISEGGVAGFEAGYWWHVTVPTGTPEPIILQLREAVNDALQLPAIRDSLLAGGFEPLQLSPMDAQRALKEDTAKWTRVIQDNKVRGN